MCIDYDNIITFYTFSRENKMADILLHRKYKNKAGQKVEDTTRLHEVFKGDHRNRSKKLLTLGSSISYRCKSGWYCGLLSVQKYECLIKTVLNYFVLLSLSFES